MKHPSETELASVFATQLASLDLVVAPAAQQWLLDYMSAVLEANRRINLTRITDPALAVRLHLVDSLAALPELLGAPIGRVLDIGSGAGFPGVPLAAVSAREFVLLDSVAKKVTAVSAVLNSLPALPGRVVLNSMRAEDLARGAGETFAAVVARAVAPLPSLVELASPLLIDDGLLIALKGRPETVEIASGVDAARTVGMKEVSRRKLTLPDGGEARTIFVYRKIERSRLNLPRRTGLAQNSPLA